jgi:small subunit ribosomal protein S16
MSTRIRLRRMGANKRPFYRVVVADQRSPRDGRFIENIGKYHPLEDPSLIEIDQERALHWLRVGAQPSSQVRNLMVKVGIWDAFVAERPSAAKLIPQKGEKPAKPKLSRKAAAKAAAAETPPAAPIEKPVEAPTPVAEAPEPEPAAPEVETTTPEVETEAKVEAASPEAVAAPEADESTEA